jgi:hypothetical protein
MREIATGQSAAVLHGMDETGALEVLHASTLLGKPLKKGLERAFLDENNPLHIGFDNDGTPEEVSRGRDQIVALQDELQTKTTKFNDLIDGPVREQLDAFAAALGLRPIDKETTEDLMERIKVARANGAQPTNPVPVPAPTTPPAPTAPQSPTAPTSTTTGSTPQPAPTLVQRAVKTVTRKGGK